MIRRATPADAEAVKAIRLEGLQDAPRAFTTTYEEAVAHSDSLWIERLLPDAHPTYLWEDDNGPQGMVVGLSLPDDAGVVHLVAMWVRPSARRSGAGTALVERVVELGRECSADAVRLEVVDDNEPAQLLYASCGFVRTGTRRVRNEDGAVLVEMERRLG